MAEPDLLRNALVHTVSNRWLDAQSAWRECFDQFPYLGSLFLADVALRVGDVATARHCTTSCEEFAPDTPYVTGLKERISTIELRQAVFEDIEQPETADLNALRNAGRGAVNCHLWERAIALWQGYIDRVGANAEAYKRLGTAYQGIGDYTNSILYFREANTVKPEPALAESLERAQRLHQRRFDSFGKHVQRILQHPAVETAQSAAATIAPLTDELARLAILTDAPGGVMSATSAQRPTQGDSVSLDDTSRAPSLRTAAATLQEVDLPALRERLMANPDAAYADLPMRSFSAPARHSPEHPNPNTVASPVRPSTPRTSLLARLQTLATKS